MDNRERLIKFYSELSLPELKANVAFSIEGFLAELAEATTALEVLKLISKLQLDSSAAAVGLAQKLPDPEEAIKASEALPISYNIPVSVVIGQLDSSGKAGAGQRLIHAVGRSDARMTERRNGVLYFKEECIEILLGSTSTKRFEDQVRRKGMGIFLNFGEQTYLRFKEAVQEILADRNTVITD